MGIVSVDGIAFAEPQAARPDKWQAIHDDHRAETPGRLLVTFWQHEGKHGAFAIYKTPWPDPEK